MNTIKWLIRREMWEHSGAMLWAPATAAAITLALLMLGLAMAGADGTVAVSDVRMDSVGSALTAKHQAALATGIAHGYIAIALPVFIALAFVVFFFCLSTLSDERRDRSVLFFKSMPISDGQTVASKALMALLVAPAIAVAVAMALSFLGLLVVLAFAAIHGLDLASSVLSTAAAYTSPLHLLSIIPVYALWALPAVGWLMLVGAVAPRRAFLWAILVPVMAGLIVSWLSMASGIDDGWFWENVSGRVIFSVVPGSWLPDSGLGGVSGMSDAGSALITHQSLALLASAKLWAGVVAGLAMLMAAAHVRRWKDEG